jgi:hypothetical protein
MNVISHLQSNGFIKIHSCGCGGGESTWKNKEAVNVLRLRNTAKHIEVREKKKDGKLLKSFSFDQITEAINYVKTN